MISELPDKETRVLCAVSGGADSMCLLHLLWSQGYDVTAAHFEHGIRGKESLRDAKFVEDWCSEHGIPVILEHGDVPAYAQANGMSLEEYANSLNQMDGVTEVEMATVNGLPCVTYRMPQQDTANIAFTTQSGSILEVTCWPLSVENADLVWGAVVASIQPE